MYQKLKTAQIRPSGGIICSFITVFSVSSPHSSPSCAACIGNDDGSWHWKRIASFTRRSFSSFNKLAQDSCNSAASSDMNVVLEPGSENPSVKYDCKSCWLDICMSSMRVCATRSCCFNSFWRHFLNESDLSGALCLVVCSRPSLLRLHQCPPELHSTVSLVCFLRLWSPSRLYNTV